METAYEIKYHQLEKQHWWFAGRRAIIVQLLKKVSKQANILEVGCSSGTLLHLLNRQGFNKLTGIDISKMAIDHCPKAYARNVSVMDGTKTTFKDGEFDVLIASDVLEHIADDQKALKEWKRILKPNGMLLVFVPAFPFLWTQHDERNKHYRRYTKTTLNKALLQAGFTSPIRTSYWNSILFFPTILVRTLQKLLPNKHSEKTDNLHKTLGIANALFFSILCLENFLLRWLNFPFGVSVFAIVKP